MKYFIFSRKQSGYTYWMKAVAMLMTIVLALSIMPIQPAWAVNQNDMVIQGTVKDEQGDRLSAEVWYYFEDSAGKQSGGGRAYSDGSGGWTFGPITIDFYYHDPSSQGWKLIVKARPADKPSAEGLFQQEVVMAPGTTLNMDIVFTTHGTVNVHITDEAGNRAPAGVPFWFSYSMPDRGGADWPWNAPFDGITPEHFTDASGTITFVSDLLNIGTAFPAGTRAYGGVNQTGQLRYEGPGDPVGLRLKPGQTTDVTIAVKPLGKITARANDSVTGQLVTSASFGYSSVSPGMNKYASSNNGELSIYAHGDLNITASSQGNPRLGLFGYDSASTTVTPVPWGEVTVDLQIARQQPGTILGRVIDGNENPFPGVTVELIWPEYNSDFGEQLTTIKQTTTAADGSYSFTGVIPSGNGAYRVRASKPDYIPALDNNVTVSSGGTTTVSELALVGDAEPPFWYEWMGLSASPGRTGILLQWPEAQDNVTATEYRVYQGDTLLDTVSGGNLSYLVTGLTPETEYTFRVEAGDAAGNWSTTGLSVTTATLSSYQPDQVIQRASVSSDGIQADGHSDNPAASADGRYVVFSSYAENLAPNDNNRSSDVFVFDRVTGETKRVSISTAGVEGNRDSTNPAISADGRFVAFESGADNLVTGDNNGTNDIFLHDLQTGITSRISVSAAGVEGDQSSYTPSVSADGRYIAFASYAENLVAGDSNGNEDIIVHDRLTGINEIASKASDGTQSSSYSENPAISSDGNFVAFHSNSRLVSSDSNNNRDIYVHNRLTHTTELISVSVNGSAGNGQSYDPTISANGRYVAFESSASDLVSGDTNGYYDIFIRDRTTGTTERVSVSTLPVENNYGSYNSSISSDGRYVAFESGADNLITGDTNSNTDIFVRDRQTGELARVSVTASGSEADRGGRLPAISGNGRYITYVSNAENLVDGDTNNTSDSIFIYDRLATAPGDTTAPNWPGGGTLSADNVDDESLTLTWPGAADNIGITGYRIYKDSVLIVDNYGSTSYNVTGLTAGTAYTFKVEAGDAAGNWSTNGPSATVTTAEPSLTITTVAGNYSLGRGYSGNGGAATSAQMNRPYAVAVDGVGRLYIADDWNNAIRMVDTDGRITTVAGLGGPQNNGFSGDNGAATSAKLYYPRSVAVDSGGNIYIADMQNSRIRMVAASNGTRYGIGMMAGNIYTVAGTGTHGYSGDGSAAVSADLNKPFGITLDSSGNLYIADTYNNRIRKVDTGGTITTVAGNGMQGYSGNGGPATAAMLQKPYAVAVASDGNLFIADATNSRIRMVAASDHTRYGIAMTKGYIYDVAGNGSDGYSGDGGPATNAKLSYPDGLAVDKDGNLYIAESYNNSIRKVDTNGIITTVAGQGPFSPGYSGDGNLAIDAKLNGPHGVTVDGEGNLLIADSGNNVIRKVYAGQPVVVPAVPISDFTSIGKTGTTASFSFTAPAGATAVKVQQSSNGGTIWTDSVTGALTAASTTATVTGLTQNTAYKFKLVVTGGSHAGDSNIVDVITDAAIITETLTVSNPSTTGFTVTLSPALAGLTGSDFILKDDQNNAVTITSAATSDNGATYTIGAALTAGKTYTVTAAKAGYNFGTAANVAVPPSSGGGGGGSSTTSAPTPEPKPATQVLDSNGNKSESIVTKLDNSTGIVSVDVDSSLLTSAFDKSKADDKGIKTVKVDIPKIDNAKAYESVLPASFLTSGDVMKAIEIKTNVAAVIVPGNMITAANAAGAQKVSLTIAAGDKSKLPADIQAQIGSRPVIELNLKINGQKVSWSNESAPVTVAVPYTPTADELKDPEHITVWYIDGSGKAVSVPNGRYDPKTGKVTFSTTHFSKYAVAFVQKSFADISGYDWAQKQIEVLAAKGIISGTSENTYSPAANITRADYLVLLLKTLGLAAEFDGNFADVEPGTYYYEAVGIAKKLGIAAGSGNNRFNPKENISRQDMMALTVRALEEFKKLEIAESSTMLDKFSDKAEIAGYAMESLATLVREGLIAGSGEKMNPRAKTTRAEAAVFLYRIYNKY